MNDGDATHEVVPKDFCGDPYMRTHLFLVLGCPYKESDGLYRFLYFQGTLWELLRDIVIFQGRSLEVPHAHT